MQHPLVVDVDDEPILLEAGLVVIENKLYNSITPSRHTHELLQPLCQDGALICIKE